VRLELGMRGGELRRRVGFCIAVPGWEGKGKVRHAKEKKSGHDGRKGTFVRTRVDSRGEGTWH
jgi:hypothetical protein